MGKQRNERKRQPENRDWDFQAALGMWLAVMNQQGYGVKGITCLPDGKRQPENQTRIRMSTNTGLGLKGIVQGFNLPMFEQFVELAHFALADGAGENDGGV